MSGYIDTVLGAANPIPGPWEVSAGGTHVGRRAGNGSLDMVADIGGCVGDDATMRATAMLIAMVPAMVNALVDIYGDFDIDEVAREATSVKRAWMLGQQLVDCES